MTDNRVEFTVGKTIIRQWYEAGYVDPSDQHEPIERPYLLKIGDNLQGFTSEAKRSAYLEWWLALQKKQGDEQ